MNTEQVLSRLKIDFTSRTVAVQQVREMCEASSNPISVAEHILQNLTAGVAFNLTDADEARMLAAHLVQDAILLGDRYDPTDALQKASEKIATRKVSDPWLFVKDEPTQSQTGMQVASKCDSKPKKGSKQILAAQLYETHKALDNKALIAIFEKELDMSLEGARTYLYTARKKSAGVGALKNVGDSK